MLTQLSKHCSLSFKPILPCEYNEEVLVENIDSNVWTLLANIDWKEINKKNLCVNNCDYYNLYVYNKREGNIEESKQKQDGNKTEQDFKELCEKHNLTYEKSSFCEDYYYHYDIEIFTNDLQQQKNLKIDIKGLKSLRRNGPKQNKYFFVELNIEGWLFGGKANYIAIEIQEKKFLIFDKAKLQKYVLNNVDFNKPIVAWPEQCFHRVYIRYPKPEMKHCSALSLINTLDAYLQCGVGKFE
jgi:hypothetical protein